MILSPDEYQIVATYPIGSRTFFMAKQLHLLAYVNVLGAVVYLPSAVTAAVTNQNPLLFLSLLIAGMMMATAIGMTFVLLYTLMLRIVNRETMQRVLGYTQLALVILIYFGYFVVTRMFGKETLAMLNGLKSNWLQLIPTAWPTHSSVCGTRRPGLERTKFINPF